MKNKFLIAFTLLTALNLQAYQFFGKDFAAPGEPYTMVLKMDEGEEMIQGKLRLSDENGNVKTVTRFFFYELENQPLWLALAGLGPQLVPGVYRIDVECQFTEGSVFYSRKIQISHRDFPEQIVELDPDLTTLRSQPDPQKAEDSRMLWTTLGAFDGEGVYETGTLIRPIQGEVYLSTDYGARRTYHYSNGEESSTLHNGLDWAVPKGTPVLAMAEGKVVLKREMIVTGNTLVIEHLPGVYSVYYHLDRFSVDLDEQVDAGSPIGLVGETGLATGPHLHWEIRISKIPVDPERLMGGSLLDKEWIISMIDSK